MTPEAEPPKGLWADWTSSGSPPPLKEIFLNLLRNIFWPALLLPPLAVYLFAWAHHNTPLYLRKRVIDEVTFYVVMVATVVFLLVYLRFRQSRYLGWLFVLFSAVTFRELHLVEELNEEGVYTNLDDRHYIFLFVLILLVAWRKYNWLAPYLESRLHVTLLATAAFTYVCTVALDHRVLDQMAILDHISHKVEEAVELLGHTLILTSGVLAARQTWQEESESTK